jgi:two-component system OmpR family response regulator
VDLVLLQAARAGSAGLNLCRRLAAQDGPAVILVSDGAQEIDRIVGLEVGADDFISQPCSQRELLARVRAVLRRRSRGGAAAAGADAAPVRFAGWTLWPGKLEVQSPGGARSLLTASDFRLLCLLLERPRQPITREQLAQLLGGAAPNLRSLDTSVSRLRRKLGSSSTGEPLIRTLHGVGYMLNCAVERGAADLARAALA